MDIKSIAWRPGSRISADPLVFDAEVEKVRKKTKGRATAQDIVDHAKAKRSPIHKMFEWDDKKAGNQWRCQQARHYLGSVMTRPLEAPEYSVRKYVVIKDTARIGDAPTRQFYENIETVLSDPTLRSQLLNNALRDANSWRRRYHVLSELSKVFAELDELVMEG